MKPNSITMALRTAKLKSTTRAFTEATLHLERTPAIQCSSKNAIIEHLSKYCSVLGIEMFHSNKKECHVLVRTRKESEVKQMIQSLKSDTYKGEEMIIRPTTRQTFCFTRQKKIPACLFISEFPAGM